MAPCAVHIPQHSEKSTFLVLVGFVLFCFVTFWGEEGGGGGFLCVFGVFFSLFLGCCLIDSISELSSAF